MFYDSYGMFNRNFVNYCRFFGEVVDILLWNLS